MHKEIAAVTRRMCWSCMGLGAGLLLLTFTATAAAGDLATGPVGWRDVAAGSIGIVMLLFGWLGTRLHSRVDSLESEAVSNDEVRQMIGDLLAPLDERSRHIEESVSAVHRRLDNLHVPNARTGQP